MPPYRHQLGLGAAASLKGRTRVARGLVAALRGMGSLAVTGVDGKPPYAPDTRPRPTPTLPNPSCGIR